MIYEFKFLPLDRKSGKTVVAFDDVQSCIEVDSQRFTELSHAVALDGNVTFQMSVFAMVLAEIMGADVFYRPKGFSTWKSESGVLPAALDVSRQTIKKQASIIRDVLEQVDNRALQCDGPVTPTKDEIRGDEFRKLYVAAKAIIKACTQEKEP